LFFQISALARGGNFLGNFPTILIENSDNASRARIAVEIQNERYP
jgi:hypothetical protein